jgi:hypothetical protein
MKTLIAARHARGPFINGYDGCHARAGNGGCCPGHQLAGWLNSLGDDHVTYMRVQETIVVWTSSSQLAARERSSRRDGSRDCHTDLRARTPEA